MKHHTFSIEEYVPRYTLWEKFRRLFGPISELMVPTALPRVLKILIVAERGSPQYCFLCIILDRYNRISYRDRDDREIAAILARKGTWVRLEEPQKLLPSDSAELLCAEYRKITNAKFEIQSMIFDCYNREHELKSMARA